MRRTVKGLGAGKVVILSSINYGCRVLSKANVCRLSSGFLYPREIQLAGFPLYGYS